MRCKLWWITGEDPTSRWTAEGPLVSYMGYILGLYRGYIGIMEKKMETTIMGLYRDYIGYILGLYWDNGKENGNYYIVVGHR